MENSETIAIKYMKEKYDLECIVIENYLYPNYSTGGSYYKVWMRCADDPNGLKLNEMVGQSYLDHVNNTQKCSSSFAVYINATQGQECQVIGDQYMWYTIYPLFDAWMNEQISQFAPCQLHCGYLNLCTTEWEYDYCFSPDFPIITTNQELEEQLSKINVNIRAYYKESFELKTSQQTWDSFNSDIKKRYMFNTFSMIVYEVPESLYKKVLSDEVSFYMIDPYQYNCKNWMFGYQNLNQK